MAFTLFVLSRPLSIKPPLKPLLCRAPSRRRHTTMSATAYESLATLCKDISNLEGISGILSWDEQVMMPSGAAASRGAQKAALAAIIHEKCTSSKLGDALLAAKQETGLGEYEMANVRDAERNYNRAIKVPPELERKIAENNVASVQAWIQARTEDSFEKFEPFLRKTLALTKEKAEAVGGADLPAYDVMIDTFERGMTADRLSEIFGGISAPLKSLLEKVLDMKEKCTKEVHPALRGGEEWDVEKQAKLSKDICQVLGFKLENGRIGKSSVHIFLSILHHPLICLLTFLIWSSLSHS